jgi:transposase
VSICGPAEAAGLGWPLPEDFDESALEQRLFPPAPTLPLEERPVPVWEAVHRELKARKDMSLLLRLARSIRPVRLRGSSHSWFCEQYRAWAGKLDLVMLPRSTARARSALWTIRGRRWRSSTA